MLTMLILDYALRIRLPRCLFSSACGWRSFGALMSISRVLGWASILWTICCAARGPEDATVTPLFMTVPVSADPLVPGCLMK